MSLVFVSEKNVCIISVNLQITFILNQKRNFRKAVRNVRGGHTRYERKKKKKKKIDTYLK